MRILSLLSVMLFTPMMVLAAGQIRIVNTDGQPIAGAKVIIGNEVGKTPGRTLETDVNGNFEIPADWKSLQSLSIRAQGYIPTSFLMVEPQEMELQIHRKDSRRYYEVKGNATGFEGIKKDGKVDVGLVYPALSRRDLLQFDISSVVSPETDTIKVLTETVGIPSNLSLPKQSETYILPVTLNKPEYRMFVRQPGTYRVTANHGQFPLKRVIKDVQAGKSVFEIINHFRFKSAGQMEITVADDLSGQDISVNQIQFDTPVDIQAPVLPANTGVVSAAMVNQGGLFFPTDIRGLKSNQAAQLKLPSNSTGSAFVLSLMTQEPDMSGRKIFPGEEISGMMSYIVQSFDLSKLGDEPGAEDFPGVSLAFLPVSGLVKPNFLDLVTKPEVLGDLRFKMNRPELIADVQPVATYMILSEVESSGGEKDFAAEKRFRVWESFQTGWPSEVNLPELAMEMDENKTYRWEVMFLGRKTDFNDNPSYFLDGITHVTRTSLDL